jgi:ParB family chromosome partitioning protein
MNEIKKPVLGRGLSALLDSSLEDQETHTLTLPTDSILPGQHQPRHHFSEEELVALSQSIKEKGILQPILVRVHPQEKEKYEIVAGERRWRAAKKIGLQHIPVLIKEYSNAEALEAGLLENIQRQDLNPIEEADAFRRLAQEFHHTQESLSQILGKSRSHIANILRLLTLPKSVQEALKEGKLSAGHGRTLVGAEDPEFLAEIIIAKNLNVRQAETLVKKNLKKEDVVVNSLKEPDPEKEVLRQHLSDLLGAPIDLVLRGEGGKIIIPFTDPSALDKILQKFNQLTVPKETITPKIFYV